VRGRRAGSRLSSPELKEGQWVTDKQVRMRLGPIQNLLTPKILRMGFSSFVGIVLLFGLAACGSSGPHPLQGTASTVPSTVAQPGSEESTLPKAIHHPSMNEGAWSDAHQIDFDGGKLVSVSCPLTSFCEAIANDGYGFTYSNGSWSAGQIADPNAVATVDFKSVSCASASFCLAVDYDGYVFAYSGREWSSDGQVNSTGGFTSISCSSSSFCVAAGTDGDSEGDAFVFSNGDWSSGQVIDNIEVASVSCASTTFCMAVDSGGNAFVYANGSWSSGQQLDSAPKFVDVSCSTSTMCDAVSYTGDEYTYTNGSWSSTREISDYGVLNSISCPTSMFCVAVAGVASGSSTGDAGGYEVTYADGAWSRDSHIDPTDAGSDDLLDPGLTSVSCPTLTFCVAVDVGGKELTYVAGS
jgi:predicted small lipoprotein YifL